MKGSCPARAPRLADGCDDAEYDRRYYDQEQHVEDGEWDEIGERSEEPFDSRICTRRIPDLDPFGGNRCERKRDRKDDREELNR